MGALGRALRRTGTVAATAAAFTLAGAGIASAHHCYKDAWQDAAYAQLSSQQTAWVSLSDLGTMFLIGPEYAGQCGYVADDVVADWMAANGLTQEPLIHSRATTGGGALYHQGKEAKPFSYLTEEDFATLTVGIIDGMATCAPEWAPPPMD